MKDFWEILPHLKDYNGDGKINGTDYAIAKIFYKDKFEEESAEEEYQRLRRENENKDDIDDLYDDDKEDDDADDIYDTEDDDLSFESASFRVTWRDTCTDGFAYDIDPEDYETEEEYEQALEQAMEEAESEEEPFFTTNNAELTPTYSDKRRKEATEMLRIYMDDPDSQVEAQRCRFILAGEEIAAKYMRDDGAVLYAQAIKDHFSLPITLPDEVYDKELYLEKILTKIQRKDAQLALEIWEWCMDQFLPHYEFLDYLKELTLYCFSTLYNLSDDFCDLLLSHVQMNPEFVQKILTGAEEVPGRFSEMIVALILRGSEDIACAAFDMAMDCMHDDWRTVNPFIENLISEACRCKNSGRALACIAMRMMPRVRAIPDGMIHDEVEVWDQEIAENMDEKEESYEDEELYEDEDDEEVEKDEDDDVDPILWEDGSFTLNPSEFRTRREYTQALQFEKTREQEIENAKETERRLRRARHEQWMEDMTVYAYAGVKVYFIDSLLSYRIEGDGIEIGDTVVVPLGPDDREVVGIVMSVGRYAGKAVPYPIERTKPILRKYVPQAEDVEDDEKEDEEDNE